MASLAPAASMLNGLAEKETKAPRRCCQSLLLACFLDKASQQVSSRRVDRRVLSCNHRQVAASPAAYAQWKAPSWAKPR